jgi:hypothetical protein
MAGFREFVTGEVLTAANVDDFLAKQAVMKFADAAARDSALGTAVAGGNALREGMVAYLDSTDEVIKYDGTDWSSVAPAIAGIGSNAVSTLKTDTFSASIVAGAITGDVTGLTVTITPTSATSKVLVLVSVSIMPAFGGFTLYRDGSPTSFIGDGEADRRRGTTGGGTGSDRIADAVAFMALDSPATTSAVTYSIRLSHSSGGTHTFFVNRGSNDANLTETHRMASTITAIEVAA